MPNTFAGKWTYADLDGSGWNNLAYDTKEEAIAEAKNSFKNKKNIVVGQLEEYIGSLYPIHQEYVETTEN